MCMKNSPMYQPGALGFTVVAGVPKVGLLQNAAWTLSETCTFKIVTIEKSMSDRFRDLNGPGTSGTSKFLCYI